MRFLVLAALLAACSSGAIPQNSSVPLDTPGGPIAKAAYYPALPAGIPGSELPVPTANRKVVKFGQTVKFRIEAANQVLLYIYGCPFGHTQELDRDKGRIQKVILPKCLVTIAIGAIPPVPPNAEQTCYFSKRYGESGPVDAYNPAEKLCRFGHDHTVLIY